MKRIIFLMLTAIAVCTASAQTNFRDITFQEALAAAKAEGRPVFIDFYTDWCGPCKAMSRNIFPLQQVGDFMNEAFVCIKLNAEKEGAEQAEQYQVNAYPTMIIVDGDGQEIYRKVGASTNADEFVDEMKAGCNPMLTPEKMRQRYADGERSAELISALASSLYRQATEDRRPDQQLMGEARQMVEDYFNTLTDSQRTEEENFFVYSYNFVDNPRQQQAQFLFNHYDSFQGGMKEKAEATVNKLLRYRMGTLLQGRSEFTQRDVDVIADAVKKTAIGGKDEFVPTFAVLSAMVQGERPYLDALKKHFDQMNVSDQINVANAIGSFIKSTDKEFCSEVNQWLRSKLPAIDSSAIYYAAMSITSLERRINPEEE